MLCPFCNNQIAPVWQGLYTATDEMGRPRQTPAHILKSELPAEGRIARSVSVVLYWARCPNELCHELLVQVTRTSTRGYTDDAKQWLAVPKRKAARPLDDIVADPFRTDFLEACALLDENSRMSAVLSRRILADVLKTYAGLTDYGLASRIDKFVSDTKHPSRLRDNLHYLREMGDFSAHTMEDDQGQIINVSKDEAEWTIKVVADLFDYFIIGPEKDKKLRDAFDEKLKQANRKPIDKPQNS